jgi:DNA-directed RNA polymerase specialized sigma24 family protein
MSADGPSSPTPTTTSTHGVFESLDHEWRSTARSDLMRSRSLVWAVAEPALTQCSGACAMVSLVTWDGHQPSPSGTPVLSALLRLALDPLAARALLQALLPRIKVENVLTARYGHGIGERWQWPADTVADLVAECFSALKRHAGEDRDDVARLVLQEATRRMRTARQAQHRYQERTVLLAPGHARVAPADLSAARSGPEWLATMLTEAVRDSRLTTADARLVYGTRVKGLPASEVGRRAGMPAKAVYYALARAERALVLRAA